MSRRRIETPLGPMCPEAQGGALIALRWSDEDVHDDDPVLIAAETQLGEYFAGTRREFDLPTAPAGTAFRRRVWRALLDIPFGRVATYGDIARALDSGPRAVGGACGANPIPIIIPCHRVLAAGGLSGGYSGAGGLATKAKLLALEGVAV